MLYIDRYRLQNVGCIFLNVDILFLFSQNAVRLLMSFLPVF